MARIDFGGVLEDVVTAEEFPLKKAQEVLASETVAVLGYGVQGPAQAMNMRDNGINVLWAKERKSKYFGIRPSVTVSSQEKPSFHWKRPQNGEPLFRC